MAEPLTPAGADALLSALAAVNAYRGGPDWAVPLPGSPEADAAFLGVLAVAGKALDEIRRLGGDPDGLLRGMYAKAMALA